MNEGGRTGRQRKPAMLGFFVDQGALRLLGSGDRAARIFRAHTDTQQEAEESLHPHVKGAVACWEQRCETHRMALSMLRSPATL